MGIEEAIAGAIAARSIEGDRRGKAYVNHVTQAIRQHWLQLVGIIRKPGRADRGQINAILQRMAAAAETSVESVLNASIEWGFDSAFEVFENHLPADWWKLAFADQPEVVLMEGVEFNFPEPGGPGPTGKGKDTKKKSAIEKLYGKPKPSAGKSIPSKKKVPKKTAKKVKDKIRPRPKGILKIIRSRGWKSRMRKWSDKITNLDRVADLIAEGKEKGKKFQTIVNSIKPFVQNFAASARRIVRTELARIENELMEVVFEAFGDIIAGFQIINPLDEKTRPTHAIRAGKIYWKDKRKKPNAADRPSLPDEANCRCCYAPVLTAPAPDELKNGPRVDTRTYSGFFNTLSDDRKKKMVGAARWNAAKDKTTKPAWLDFVDPKTGRLIDPGKLKKETEKQLKARRGKQKERQAKDVKAAKKALKNYES